MRIPIRVEDNNSVGRLQVQAETTGARRQNEDEIFRVRSVELFEKQTAVVRFRSAVQTQVLVT